MTHAHTFFRLATSGKQQLFLVIALLLAWGTVAHGQQNEMTLSQMINSALENNYNVQVFKNRQKQAANSNTIGNAGMLPRLDITGEKSISIENSEQQFFSGDGQQADAAKQESLNAAASLSWVVFDGLAMFARKDRLAQLEELGKTDTRYFLEQTAQDLSFAYYQLKLEQNLLDVYAKNLEVSKSRLHLQEESERIGAGSLLEVQRARVDRNTDSSMVLSQHSAIRELEIEINRIMNTELTNSVTTTTEFDLVENLDVVDLLELATSNNAELNQQQIEEIIAAKELKMNRGAMYPELELFGNYRFGKVSNEVGFLMSSQAFGPNFGVRVRFNLFNGNQKRIAVQNAKIETETRKLETEQTSQTIQAAVRVAYLRWQSENQQMDLEIESVQEARKTLTIADRQYELGAINDVDFRTIQLNALNAESRLMQAEYRAKVREIELYRLSGQLLEKIM